MTVRLQVAMVLAAGRGERLRPLSDVLPKPALPLPDGPVVGWGLRLAVRCGVSHITANTWHLAPRMEAVLEEARPEGVTLSLSREPELLGTAGGLAEARDRGLLGRDGSVLVINGDGVLGLDLEPVLERHAAGHDLVTLALLPHLDPHRWSRVTVDAAGRVADILPPGDPTPNEVPLLYPGVMVVARPALDLLPTNVCGVSEALWRPARALGRLGGVVVSGHWREVGTPADYLETVQAHLGDTTWIDPTARVHPRARLRSCLIGRGSVIGSGTVVEASIVAEGAVVPTGVQVRRSILLGRLTVEPGAIVENAVLAAS